MKFIDPVDLLFLNMFLSISSPDQYIFFYWYLKKNVFEPFKEFIVSTDTDFYKKEIFSLICRWLETIAGNGTSFD